MVSKALEKTLLIIILTTIVFFISVSLGNGINAGLIFGPFSATLVMGGFILYGIDKLREELSIKMNANNILLKDEQDLTKNKE